MFENLWRRPGLSRWPILSENRTRERRDSIFGKNRPLQATARPSHRDCQTSFQTRPRLQMWAAFQRSMNKAPNSSGGMPGAWGWRSCGDSKRFGGFGGPESAFGGRWSGLDALRSGSGAFRRGSVVLLNDSGGCLSDSGKRPNDSGTFQNDLAQRLNDSGTLLDRPGRRRNHSGKARNDPGARRNHAG